MSDKKYPYIGKGNGSGNVVVFFNEKSSYFLFKGINSTALVDLGYCSNDWEEALFKNITREYLTNTYGKCESQEHTDFIYSLADNHGIEVYSNHYIFDNKSFFYFCDNELHLNHDGFESFARKTNKKLIHLPLPPKEKEVEETKPIYTKEMNGRGLLPKVGMKCLIAYKGGNTLKGKIKYISKDGFVYEREDGKDSFNGSIDIVEFEPIPTIEDELIEFLNETFSSCAYSIEGNQFLVKELTDKYNITPKAQK